MNTANLQLEGLCLAIAGICRALASKGLLSQDEIEGVLRQAEAAATSDDRFVEQLSPAHRDAVCFPIRILRLANADITGDPMTFAELAKAVGETKQPYNDQR